MAQSDANPWEETRIGHYKQDRVDIDIGCDKIDGEIKHIGNTETDDAGWLRNSFLMETKVKQSHRRQNDVVIINAWETACERIMEEPPERVAAEPEFRKVLNQKVPRKRLGCWCQTLEEDIPTCHGEQVASVADAITKRGEHER